MPVETLIIGGGQAALALSKQPTQRHRRHLVLERHRNHAQLPKGAVLVVGAGSSGAQIAHELIRPAGKPRR